MYFGGHFGSKMAAIANQRWISIRNIIIYLETKFRPNRRIFVFGGHFVPWLPWQQPPFWITVDIPIKVWWKESNLFLNLPFFVSMATAAKFIQPIPIILAYLVRRVTGYDHFCVFQIFSILAVSMATAAILKIPKVVCTSTHSA